MNQSTETAPTTEFNPQAAPPRTNEPPIVFFDGVCNLCNRSVSWLLWLDAKHRRLRFAPLQGETAEQLFAHTGPLPADERSWSMLLWDHKGLHQRSDAALRVLWHLGGCCRVLSYVRFVVPRFLRDALYKCIARFRYSWFGKRDTCRLPTPEERAQFLP